MNSEKTNKKWREKLLSHVIYSTVRRL